MDLPAPSMQVLLNMVYLKIQKAREVQLNTKTWKICILNTSQLFHWHFSTIYTASSIFI